MIPKPSPVGEGAPQGRMRGKVCRGNPLAGDNGKVFPHQSAGAAPRGKPDTEKGTSNAGRAFSFIKEITPQYTCHALDDVLRHGFVPLRFLMEYKLGSISVYSFNALYRAYTLVRNRRTDWRIKKSMAAAIANTIVRNPKSTLYYKMLQSICQFDVRFQTTTKSRKPAPQAADFRERCPFAEFFEFFEKNA